MKKYKNSVPALFLTVAILFLIPYVSSFTKVNDLFVSSRAVDYIKTDDFFCDDTITIFVGQTINIGPDYYYDEDEDIDNYYNGYYYISSVYTSDDSVAEVYEEDGIITIKGMSEGSSEISAYNNLYYDNCYGTVTVNVIKASASDISVSSIKDQVYTGKAIAPNITVKMGNKTLEKNVDYTVKYKNNINAGKATVEVTFMTLCDEKVLVDFNITKASSSKVTVDNISKKVYTGKAICPEPVVKFSGTKLIKGTDYTVTYKNNTNYGKASAIITMKGNFSGTITKNFQIIGKYDCVYNNTVLPKHSASVYIGKTLKLSSDDFADCDIFFDEYTDSEYNWEEYFYMDACESQNSKIATVSVKEDVAVIKGVSAGTVKIFVYDKDEKIFDILTLTVNKIPTSKLTVSGIGDQKYTGKAITPVPTIKYGSTTLKKDTDFTVSYKNNTKVGKGTATIKLTGKYTGTITKNFNIIPAISKTSATVYLKSPFTLTVKSSDKITWKTSNKAIATVSSNGVVTGVKAGTATITATTAGKVLTCKVTVKNQSLNATSKTVYTGATYTLSYNGGSGTIVWKSSNTKIATVSSKGIVKGISAGTATITATRNGKSLTCKVTVKNQSLSSTSLSITVGDKKTLKLNGAVSTIIWKTSNKAIATVDKNGVVKGIKGGTATISATHNNKVYKCTVTVKNKPAISIKDVDWYINSVGGFEPEVTITNNRSKDIKYINFDMYFYDRFGDPLYNDIAYNTYENLRIIGPLYAKKTDTFYWDPVFYNDNISAVRIKNVVVTYVDGKTEKVSYNMLWYDNYYYYK